MPYLVEFVLYVTLLNFGRTPKAKYIRQLSDRWALGIWCREKGRQEEMSRSLEGQEHSGVGNKVLGRTEEQLKKSRETGRPWRGQAGRSPFVSGPSFFPGAHPYFFDLMLETVPRWVSLNSLASSSHAGPQWCDRIILMGLFEAI